MGLQNGENMSNKIRCPLCPKKYQSYKDLKKHMERIHDGSMTIEDIKKFNTKPTLGACIKNDI